MLVLHVANAIRGGDPERTVVGHSNLEYYFAHQPLFQRILTKMTIPESKESAAVRSYPQVAVPILGQSPDAGVYETVALSINLEALSLENRQSAIAANPNLAIVARQYGHRDIVGQSVAACVHAHNTMLEPN
jgi:hypothetical protein